LNLVASLLFYTELSIREGFLTNVPSFLNDTSLPLPSRYEYTVMEGNGGRPLFFPMESELIAERWAQPSKLDKAQAI
jgi:hypothetical protein